jgi:hypothetical protein
VEISNVQQPHAGDLAALNNALSALTNLQVSLQLVGEHLGAIQRQVHTWNWKLVLDDQGAFIGVANAQSEKLEYDASSDECLGIQSDCKYLTGFVEKLWDSQREIDEALDKLPPHLVATLNALTQSPWVASVRRHCVDKVLAWPGEVHHQRSMVSEKVGGTITELLSKAEARDPYETWKHYETLIFGYKSDLIASRDAVKGRVGESLSVGSDSRVIRDKHSEARDKWIYEECCRGTAYDRIAIILKKKPKGWARIDSKQGVRNAAIRYAKRHKLPDIPKRQE